MCGDDSGCFIATIVQPVCMDVRCTSLLRVSDVAQGIAIIRQLRQLEERTGRRVHELFDLICGTSTGGILAVALALKHFTLDECEQIYR